MTKLFGFILIFISLTAFGIYIAASIYGPPQSFIGFVTKGTTLVITFIAGIVLFTTKK